MNIFRQLADKYKNAHQKDYSEDKMRAWVNGEMNKMKLYPYHACGIETLCYLDTKGFSRAHDIRLFGGPVVKRQYRLNGQGRALADNLSSGARDRLKSGGSRYAWPAALKKREATRKAMIDRLQIAYDRINRNLAAYRDWETSGSVIQGVETSELAREAIGRVS